MKAEHQRPEGSLQPLAIPEWKWENITMDFVIGLPRTLGGNNAVWVIVDRLTKSAHFLPMKVNFSLDRLAYLYVKEIVRMHGVPVSIGYVWFLESTKERKKMLRKMNFSCLVVL